MNAFRAVSLSVLCLLALSCGTSPQQRSLTVYSGRSESLIKPLLDRFGETSGIDVRVRYGGTSELTATLLEEGAASPAAAFISQDAAALGALSAEGLLRPLPDEVLSRVSPAFRGDDGSWIGLSGRARTVVYNTERVQVEQLPRSLEALTDPRYRGRFGVAPTNASFQAHMAVYLALNGEQALQSLLQGIVANRPQRYPKNSPIVAAVISGEIDWGLVNHYYLWRALKEDPAAPARNFFMPDGAASTWVNVSGIGLLQDSAESRALVEFLLGQEAQTYFSNETYEYPLVAGVAAPIDLPPLPESTAQVDYREATAALDRTLELIRDSGLMEF